MWAAGYSSDGPTLQTLVEHWTGTDWAIVASPNIGTGSNALNAIANAGGLVSAAGLGNDNQTLVERYPGPCSTPTPSPTPPPVCGVG